MGSSSGFGSVSCDCRPFQTRFPFGFVSIDLTSPHNTTRRRINQKARRRAFALRPLVDMRFQVLFHPPPGVLFTFPSRYLFAIGQRVVFSLGGWSPQIQTGFLGSRPTRVRLKGYDLLFAYGTFTLFGRPSQTFQLNKPLPSLPPGCSHRRPTTTITQRPWAYTRYGFGLFPFRSPLLRESLSISFPRVTEMVHFTRFASPVGDTWLPPGGFPHSDIDGSTLARSSPSLFAACHVLLRLPLPRHPPHALITLTFLFSFQ